MALVITNDSLTQVVVVDKTNVYVPIMSAQLSPGKWRGILSAFSFTGTLSVGAGNSPLPVDATYTITSVRAHVGSAPVGAAIILDVNKNGTTIFTTQANRPTIAAGNTDSGVATPDVTTLSAGDIVTVDVDQVGSTPGSNLVVTVNVSRALT